MKQAVEQIDAVTKIFLCISVASSLCAARAGLSLSWADADQGALGPTSTTQPHPSSSRGSKVQCAHHLLAKLLDNKLALKFLWQTKGPIRRESLFLTWALFGFAPTASSLAHG